MFDRVLNTPLLMHYSSSIPRTISMYLELQQFVLGAQLFGTLEKNNFKLHVFIRNQTSGLVLKVS